MSIIVSICALAAAVISLVFSSAALIIKMLAGNNAISGTALFLFFIGALLLFVGEVTVEDIDRNIKLLLPVCTVIGFLIVFAAIIIFIVSYKIRKLMEVINPFGIIDHEKTGELSQSQKRKQISKLDRSRSIDNAKISTPKGSLQIYK